MSNFQQQESKCIKHQQHEWNLHDFIHLNGFLIWLNFNTFNAIQIGWKIGKTFMFILCIIGSMNCDLSVFYLLSQKSQSK